ncbi:MAG TPA: trypsin-like peptidase domain-containing protein [Acidimicrobiales bacterium]|nr:trypsin-like peptidase domain-containing protein [Acidimicrobiales bacterium]
MEHDDSLDAEGPIHPWLPPEDRIWRHPSEVAVHGSRAQREVHRSRGERRAIAVAALAGMTGALLTAGVVAAAGGFRTRVVEVPAIERVAVAMPTSLGITSASGTDVVAVAARIRPAIVQIRAEAETRDGREIFEGSGVIYRSDGLILTNHHVVDGADEITVILANGRKLDADVLGSDEESDVAVVRVHAGEQLLAATLGSATRLKVGQTAIAIGSPLGLEGGPSLSVGVVSALGRTLPRSEQAGGSTVPLLDMIQTDAPIAPGSSGGALLDGAGAVIGITTAQVISESIGAEGLGFATPIDIARLVADQIERTGEVTHVWLGIEGEDVDEATAAKWSIDGGAMVKRVVSGAPAADAAIEPMDVIVGIDGRNILTMAALKVILRAKSPGDKVLVELRREGARKTVTATLEERPDA